MENVSVQNPILIVGQGLAGTALAWCLWERGVPFLIVDPDVAQTSSKVAAGLITPVTGIRIKQSWRVRQLLPHAMTFYRRMEETLGATFYHEVPLVRLFRGETEAGRWRARREDADVQEWIDGEVTAQNFDHESFNVSDGGFQQHGSGWLDTVAYLKTSRDFFTRQGCWRKGSVEEDDLEPCKDGVGWQGTFYSHAVLCRGWEQSKSRFFSWLNFGSARGVIVDLQVDLAEKRLINRGCWMQARGNGLWRAGSTYEFDFSRPVEESMAELRVKLEELLKVPFTMDRPNVGIRPIIKHRPLVVGRHPVHSRLAVFNGLGSKGVLRAPFFAEMLVADLLQNVPVEAEVEIE